MFAAFSVASRMRKCLIVLEAIGFEMEKGIRRQEKRNEFSNFFSPTPLA